MKIIRTIQEMQNLRKKQKGTIGFVPTMGFLHQGHLSLMKRARKENDLLITSIFVNPLQFGPQEDFEEYPRDEKKDIEKAKEIGVDVLFVPAVDEMYPKEISIEMSVKKRVDVLCGRSRPGHFDGVVTVLTKLFNLIQPHEVYFGLKDAQQVAVVATLIEELNYPINLNALPTIREPDGLAKSSRNVRLSKEEREEAVYIYEALKKGLTIVEQGTKQSDLIIKEVIDFIKNHMRSCTIDYVELLSYPDLTKQSLVSEGLSILAVAVHFNHVRLIDSILFNQKGKQIYHVQF